MGMNTEYCDDQVVSMESLVSCLGAGDGEGGGGGGEVEKLAQQLATLEVRLWVFYIIGS